jgi:hypothetical protein
MANECRARRTIKTVDEYSVELISSITANRRAAFSLYVDHLKCWVELFGRQELLILSYDEFLMDPWKTGLRIEGFLGLKLNDEFRTMNAQNVSTEISTIAKEVLGELF